MTIENFFKAYAHGLATGDRTQYSELYTADCETCRTLDVNISLVRERGDRARGGEIKIWRSEMLSSAAPGRIAWLLEVELAPLHVGRADGSTFDDKGFQGRMQVEVAPNPNGGSRFAVSGIDTDPVDR
ncbi:hypothetical protein ACTVBU_05015 [Sanguibacter sp. A246]|uniref:hypothetical protein n=1 Tax=Sanguibacter sp. A246 TaxID=3457326 RepID=UPI003FD71B31